MEDKPKIPKQEPAKVIAWVIVAEAFATAPLWKDWAMLQINQVFHLIWP
jgi:hypothetical protein